MAPSTYNFRKIGFPETIQFAEESQLVTLSLALVHIMQPPSDERGNDKRRIEVEFQTVNGM